MEAVTTAFLSAIVMTVSFIVLLMRLPPRWSVWILDHRLFVDSVSFIGTFLLLASFSNSFVALLTGGFMGLITSGFLEVNHHTQFVERIMVFARSWSIRKIKKAEKVVKHQHEHLHLVKRRFKLEQALLLAQQRLRDPS
jgi:hypothetical protein